MQIYLIIGISAKSKSNQLFEQKELIRDQIENTKTLKNLTYAQMDSDEDIKLLRNNYKAMEQQQDANYELLSMWNTVWQSLFFMDSFSGKIRSYRALQYEYEHKGFKDKIEHAQEEILILEDLVNKGNFTNEELALLTDKELTIHREILTKSKYALEQSELQKNQDITRNRFFLNTIASEYAITSIQKYFLPLLYGLLGSVFFILRILSKDIKNLTYTPSVDINYRLRIPTGALAGLTISWFADVSASGFAVSGYAISFLVGYNVEVLFAMMDKAISQLSGEKPEKPTPKTAAKPATGK